MGGILAVFALGAIGWWCLTILFVIFGFFASDRDYDDHGHIFWPVFVLILYLLFMQYIAKVDVLSSIIHHPGQAILYILGYFALGFVWSFVKWWLFVNTVADKYRDARAKFLEEHPPRMSAVPSSFRNSDDGLRRSWESVVYSQNLQKPIVSKHKNKITVWIMYWPISAIWSLLDDFIKKMVRQIITAFQRFYQLISDRAFRKFDTDIPK
jgi:hypothetical protein